MKIYKFIIQKFCITTIIIITHTKPSIHSILNRAIFIGSEFQIPNELCICQLLNRGSIRLDDRVQLPKTNTTWRFALHDFMRKNTIAKLNINILCASKNTFLISTYRISTDIYISNKSVFFRRVAFNLLLLFSELVVLTAVT